MSIEINGAGVITGVDSLSTPAVTNTAGSASAPSITFTGDTNTGVYSPGADQVAISTGGSGRLFVDASGNVGIGNNAPLLAAGYTSLRLNGSTGGLLELTSAATRVLQIQSFSAAGGAQITTIDNGSNPPLIFGTNSFERLRITSAGLVGVGTSSPQAVMHLERNVAGEMGLFVYNSNAGGYGAVRIGGTDRGTNGDHLVYGGNELGFAAKLTAPIVFLTNGSERARLDSSGRLGIGTSSPSGLLTLAWNSSTGINAGLIGQVNNSAGANNGYRIGLRTSSDASNWCSIDQAFNNLGTDASTYIAFTTTAGYTAAERMRLTSTGLGIGTTSPSELLTIAPSSGSAGALVSGPASNAGFIEVAGGASTVRSRLQSSTTDAWVGTITNHPLWFSTNNTERARIDTSGRLLVGTSTSIDGWRQQIVDSDTQNFSVFTGRADSLGPRIGLKKSRGSTASPSVVSSGDAVGTVAFFGYDGSTYIDAATIRAEVDGTPGANDMPGRLVFSTTADGASSPTERMRIFAEGSVRISNAAFLYPATDNAVSLGATGQRFSAVWAANGTIQTSDQRAKADITTATLGAEFIKALRPVSYKWIEGGKRDTGKRDKDNNYIYEPVSGERTHWGFIAQEVKQAVDAAGVDFGGWVLTDKDDPDSQQALRYDQFIAPLTKALQEALAEIDVLKAKVAALESA